MKFIVSIVLLFCLYSCVNSGNNDTNHLHSLAEQLNTNNEFIINSNRLLLDVIKETVKKNTKYAPIRKIAIDARTTHLEFISFIEDLKNELIEESGGIYSEESLESTGKLINPNDSAAVQMIFLSEVPNPAKGPILKNKIKSLINDYWLYAGYAWDLDTLTTLSKSSNDEIIAVSSESIRSRQIEKEQFKKHTVYGLPLKSPESPYYDESWSDYMFKNKSAQEVLVKLTQIENNAYLSYNSFLQKLSNTMTGKLELIFDKFDLIVQAPISSIPLGETYEAEISLGVYSSRIFDCEVFINGEHFQVLEGKTKYTTKAKSLGKKCNLAKFLVKNPHTGRIETFKREFCYQVVPPVSVKDKE